MSTRVSRRNVSKWKRSPSPLQLRRRSYRTVPTTVPWDCLDPPVPPPVLSYDTGSRLKGPTIPFSKREPRGTKPGSNDLPERETHRCVPSGRVYVDPSEWRTSPLERIDRIETLRRILHPGVDPTRSEDPSRKKKAAEARTGMRCLRSSIRHRRSSWIRGGAFHRKEDVSSPRSSLRDHSPRANEELLLLFFQMDVCTRLQRALNNEQYEVAKKLRERRDQVDSAMEKLIQAKNPDSESKQGITDVAAEGLRLRTELRRCIEEERYEDAAKVRDRLREVETALANVSDASISGLERQYQYTLGQIVLHREEGYRGVICGRDSKCFETEDWMETSGSMSWERGIEQPFYLVLADAESWEMDTETIVVAYVPEENLRLPANDLEKLPVEHPYLYLLFLGLDGQGDLVPSKWLRERYHVERRDVYCHEDDLDGEEKRGVDDDPDNGNN